MGIFNFFRKPVILQHAELGTLYFEKTDKQGNGYYQGMVPFGPVSHEVELFIDGRKDGVDAHAMSLYKWLLNNYAQLLPSIKAQVQDTLDKAGTGPVIKDFPEEFKLNIIHLFTDPEQPSNWAISYLSLHNDHDLTVGFDGFRMVDIEMDGLKTTP